MLSTVGTPPTIIAHTAYCCAYGKVSLLAPIILSNGSMNMNTPAEYTSDSKRAPYTLNAQICLALSFSNFPSNLDIRLPPPMPNRFAIAVKNKWRTNASDSAATLYGSFVFPHRHILKNTLIDVLVHPQPPIPDNLVILYYKQAANFGQFSL